jgi:SAM-dependent MidA family methyltransferase
MGGPGQLILAELGPGRGTLMADLLRAAGKAAGFASAAEVHLVEISPALRRLQDEKLGPGVQWHQDMASLPEDAPLLVIANEFFDAIPIRQFVRRAGRWHERLIGLEKGSLALGLAPVPTPLMAEGVEGGVLEIAPQREAIAEVLAKRLVNQGGALLAIDYGHFKPATGDTLQAMQAHSFVPIVHQPGLADITSHVDFDALAQAFERGGAVVPPAMTQGAFLTAMGLGPRVEALTRRLSGHERDAVLTGAGRLAEDGQMGHLFKVICAHGPQTPTPYPFGQT